MTNDVVRNIPTVFIIFGATGDLMARKIAPALFHLFIKGKFPNLFKIIAFSRRDLTLEEFQEQIRQILRTYKDGRAKKEDIERFLEYFIYKQGNFEDSTSYDSLANFLGRIDGEWKVCSNKLFYLAVPPQYYESIFKHLKTSGLTIPCGPDEGWTRVIVEKPFGRDLVTAQKLDELLGKLFKEEQIYRIDHYLAKDMMQNILSFRFSNDLFKDMWSSKYIERIDIRILESIGISGRGDFYDDVGALRDVGQNHALQMISLVTMDQPEDFTAENVRRERAKVLSTLKRYSEKEVDKLTFRGQFAGFHSVEGVKSGSRTETYFKLVAYLNSPKWEGVPIVIESGKELINRKEIVVTFKHAKPCLCPPGLHLKNRVIFSIDPKEAITVEFWSKKPGLTFEMEKQKLSFLYRDARKRVQYVEEYEKLLLDCIAGNQLLFVSTEEVGAMWKFVDTISEAWVKDSQKPHMYKPRTSKILKDSLVIEKGLS